MGRPLRCIPQPSQFIGYSSLEITSTTSTTSTLPPENLSKYILLPISGFPCPQGVFATTTSTSTTLPPLVIDNDITNCNLFNINLIFDTQEVEFNCGKFNKIPASGSAVVRYQPCGSGVFLNQIIYQNKDFCVVKDNIRLLSGDATLQKLAPCQKSLPCDIIITELICDIQIKNITCDIQIELLSL